MAIEIQAKNPTIQMGTQGPRGERGPKGDPFTYDDFTPEQLESLKGPKGDPFTYNDFTPEQLESLKGPKGDPFTYDDFTPEELEQLKGPKGDPFTYVDFTEAQLESLKGPKGDAFTYADFTPEQLEQLKGAKGDAFTYNDFTAEQLEQLKGPKGDKGDAFTYADFTEAQLELLKGPKGDPFTYNDFTEAQLESLKGQKGDKGDAFTYNDFTPEQLELLKGPKGDKGDAFTYADFTPEQLELLKGQKGDAFTYNDFTPEQLESLKGPKGDKGDAFTYADFTVEQLASLKGPKGDPFTYNDFTPEQLELLKGPKGDTGAPGPTYTAGENITISADNVISATGGGGGSYTLPVATDYRLGGVKAMPTAVGNTGDDVLVDDDGRLHIPKATTRFIGGVKPDGTTIKIDTNGVISATGGSGGGGSYTLPTASDNTLGGVKAPSEDITIKAERGYCYIDEFSRLYVPVARSLEGGSYGGANPGVVLPSATQFEMNGNVLSLLPSSTTTLGGVKVDGTTTTTDTDGTIHAHYTLPTASTTTLGGVKVDGTSITIDGNGVISTALPTKTSDLTNDSGFITNEYHDPTKQNTLVAGNNITIADDGTISASHPARYIDGANVSGNTLKLFYNDDTSVVFTPTGGSGGGSGGVSGYAFSSTQTLTDADKAHLKEIYINQNIHMTIDKLTVVRIMAMGAKRGFVVVNTNGATSNQVLVYMVDIDSSLNVISDTFSLFLSYYLAGNSSQLTGDIITSENWSQYISAGGGSDWVGPTTDQSMSDLYNVKQLWIIYQGATTGAVMQSVIRFDYDGTASTLGGRAHSTFYLHHDDVTSNQVYIDYDGTTLNISGGSILGYFYKT